MTIDILSIFSKEMNVFLLSMVPVVELRGAIPLGAAQGLPWYTVLLLSIAGNMLPIPFIILLGRKVLDFMKRFKTVRNIAEKLELRAIRKSKRINDLSLVGLALFVAIPLPGTGAWTGALIAALLDIRLRRSLPAIFVGVLAAAFIVCLLSYGAMTIFQIAS